MVRPFLSNKTKLRLQVPGLFHDLPFASSITNSQLCK